MRTRLTKSRRRADILAKARQLIMERGLTGTEMEDIRLACGISRGGLYHHFENKRAVLAALVENEVEGLAQHLDGASENPLTALIQAGSSHLGSASGVVSALSTNDERLDYLSALEQAFAARLSAPLSEKLQGFVRPGIDPDHIAELFLTINAHINRREILGSWQSAEAAAFAATALKALAPLLSAPTDLDPLIAALGEPES